MLPRPPSSTLFPYTTLFDLGGARRALDRRGVRIARHGDRRPAHDADPGEIHRADRRGDPAASARAGPRSEEHTSELQSRQYLVCRLLLEKKKDKPGS